MRRRTRENIEEVATAAARWEVDRPESNLRVDVTSVFVTTGKVKCAGTLSALPWNPHEVRTWPQFEVAFNGEWVLVEVTDWHQDVGWIAQSVESLDLDDIVSPRVELRTAPR
jgi:hypothetical protein